MLEKLEDRIIDLSEKLEGIAAEHNEQAVELAASVAQAGALYNLIWPATILIIAVPLVCFSFFCGVQHEKNKAKEGWQVGMGLSAFGALAVGLVAVAAVVAHWTNPVLWKAAADPYFALAAEVLGKLP
ncbi:hypothetical protein LCGC14_2262360 [marine sediment metagenome]|uniref:Uncharacterized protein n=1 Tax=marine sediment metagenome TaxID=412755 RepID=A0A0F9FBM7_9ZZZZ